MLIRRTGVQTLLLQFTLFLWTSSDHGRTSAVNCRQYQTYGGDSNYRSNGNYENNFDNDEYSYNQNSNNNNNHNNNNKHNSYDNNRINNDRDSYYTFNDKNGGGGSGRGQDCALILRRMMPGFNDVGKSYAPSFKAMLEALRGGRNRANSHALDYYYYDNNAEQQQEEQELGEVCLSYRAVDEAIEEAMRTLRYSRPADIDSLEPQPESIGQTAEVIQLTTRLLARRFRLSHDEILNGLPLVDMSRTSFWRHCPAHVKPMQCRVQRYRTLTGHCNNLENPSWGAANTAFVRYLPPVYSDGIDGLRQSVVKGKQLPHARLVIRSVHRDQDHPSTDMTIMFMSWGQFIDHDVALAMPPRFFIRGKETEIDCCKLEPGQSHPLCMPFPIPPGDPVYGPLGRECHDFKRSIAGHRPNCALGPRVHVNILTSHIDANFIYGSTEAVARRLRTFSGGQLKSWNRFSREGLKPLLPPEDDNPDLECTNRPRNLFCFLAGDTRVNEQIHLTVLHTLYMRDHNRMAAQLAELNPHWDDERLYQETRHIMAAAVQHITLNEFLPMLLGKRVVAENNLTEAEGYWYGYDPNAHTSPSQAFTTAAFRYGHTFIQGKVMRYGRHHQFLGAHSLRFLLRHPFIIYEPGRIDELAMGLVDTPSQTYDPFISKEVAGHLFQEPWDHVGLDLPSINLMRGREQGTPGYNFYREWCGMRRAETFEELIPWVGNHTAYLYSTLYAHPDDIDLWSGGISEEKMHGALVGPTFGCIIARNFANIRKGDRFWFENPGFPSSFTLPQLREIRKATQSKILCDNGDRILTIQRWALRQAHPIHNPRVPCEQIPSIDLRVFKENPDSGGFGDQNYGNGGSGTNAIDYR